MCERERSIWTAASNNDLQLLESLLSRQPELIAARDAHQWTPLHQASACSSMEVLAALLERGADVNARGQADETPLHLADNEPVTWLLVRYGADPRLEDRNGMTTLDFVDQHRQPGLYQMLLEAIAALDSQQRLPPLN